MSTFRFASAMAMIGATCALTSCDTPSATRPLAAFDPTVLTNGQHYRWPSGTHVRIAIATTNLPASADLSGALDRAIAAWKDVPQFGEVVLERASSPSTADILLYDQVTPIPVQPAVCSFDPHGASGYTYFCPSQFASASPVVRPDHVIPLPLVSGGGTVAVAIRVDRGRVATTAAYDAVVAHELGHALGIGGHSDHPDDLMYGSPTATTPTARDKATLRSVLGSIADIWL